MASRIPDLILDRKGLELLDTLHRALVLELDVDRACDELEVGERAHTAHSLLLLVLLPDIQQVTRAIVSHLPVEV
jgi:hypothetical protein